MTKTSSDLKPYTSWETRIKLEARIEEQQEWIRELEAALRFYADLSNWEKRNTPIGPEQILIYTSPVHMDLGKIAKAALEDRWPCSP